MANTRHHGWKQKQRHFGHDWGWLQATPSWHHRLFHTKPQRVEHRRRLQAVLRGDEEQVWPCARKPHKYYW